MELRHLRYFVALAEELHYAHAAERLNIAPPTLTVQIQEIERSLSARLFARTKRSVSLTPAGDIFLVEARNVLEQFARAESVGRRAGRGEVGRVEIGYIGSAVYSGILKHQMSTFSDNWPGVDLNAREMPMAELPQLVASGAVDIGFVRLPIAVPRSLQVHVLLKDYFCLASPTALQHGQGETISASRLANASFITPEQEAGTFEVARRGRFKPVIVAAPGSLLTVLTQVSLGAGVAVVPSVVQDVIDMPGVKFYRIRGQPILSEVAAVYRSNESSPAVAKFIQQIQSTPERTLRRN